MMIRLYRYFYLLAAVYFSKLRCVRVMYRSVRFTQDSDSWIAVDSSCDKHSYMIFYGTTFTNVKKWQRENKIKKQSILLLQCSLVDCVELPRNIFTIGAEVIDTSTDERWRTNGKPSKTLVEAIEAVDLINHHE